MSTHKMTKTFTRLKGLQKIPLRLCISFLASMPLLAYSAGGGNVELKFTSADRLYLYLSLAFGAIALIAAAFISKRVLIASPGNEKMQAVGLAIKEGALAYLQKQVKTMALFVAPLAAGLYFLYAHAYGTHISTYIALSFIGGVAASYTAGYIGMLMAINGNTRTANAALTSYKKTLEIAFQSGAVAGLATVGMGLIGATLIFLLAGADAMKMLIGFGFGGSLAALFMRVGGGIFTKAADVGADLVGKVEAGIPEDDPRNPATIADNVGDNVGDCAGMAADVFESYEVTLVAAIILGAATAAIFDSATWMRLILFALMARGVGILASIFGIFTVKGNNNINADPLVAIRGGFTRSALVAIVGTLGVAWLMMGGDAKTTIKTTQFTSLAALEKNELLAIKSAQAQIAKEKNIPLYQVELSDVQNHQSLKKLGLNTPESAQPLEQALTANVDQLPNLKPLEGFNKVDFNNPNEKILKYSVLKQVPEKVKGKDGKESETFIPKFVDFKTAYANASLEILKLKVTQGPLDPTQKNRKDLPKPLVREVLFGPIDKETANKQFKLARERGIEVDIAKRYPVNFYTDRQGSLLIGLSNEILNPHRSQLLPINYFKEDAATLQQIQEDRKKGISKPFPTPEAAAVAVAQEKSVEWWRFVVCIVFGILMAFAIEKLTDYYVSTSKKPVQEVANVASAGPAPMIIQGIAYGKESSVFSVFAIVLALIVPMIVFPPANYGGYILSFYGIALVGLGLLTTTGYILAMDTFGPISDNAQGVFEMSGAGHENPEAAKAVQRLDAAGNTTKALTKGFAIATAVVAAVALFHSYLEDAMLKADGLRLEIPEIFLGLLIGGAAPYLFSAFSINAVGRASFKLINEVRDQFKKNPGIMNGTSKPNYGRCVAIVTAAAQKELLGPGILAIALPILVAFGFAIGKPTTTIGGAEYNLVGAQALGGFLAGAILSGQLMAVLLANSGGMWDNAKKLIEDGLHGGKGTEAHKASVVCDTVGDPFKDTAGPALNPLIKVMNLVALLLAPVVIQPHSQGVLTTVTLLSFGMLVVAIWWSKRGSLSSEMDAASEGTNRKDSSSSLNTNTHRSFVSSSQEK